MECQNNTIEVENTEYPLIFTDAKGFVIISLSTVLTAIGFKYLYDNFQTDPNKPKVLET